MSNRKLNLIGDRYGRLTVIREDFTERTAKRRRRFWECLCDCGNTAVITQDSLRRGLTKSCGCLFKEVLNKNNTISAARGIIHKPAYMSWFLMKQRCTNPNNKDWHRYGGRGISVCHEWFNNSKLFVEWAESNGWAEGLTLDRINSNGNYEPSNCKWSTRKEQANNRNPRGTFS